ncbi:MAG: aldo/keto reductase [Chlorobiaceae bacterium]|nr:aldo/keto reductase [Chlorobiaceae bacterium]NTW73442.1 aldo/keto reductase [Chlorobiaceae bacterium]
MQTRQLGNTSMQVTAIGLGTWAIGGAGWAYGWGAQDDSESITAIRRAVELGVNWIDTAAVYGLGHAEELVGRALVGIGQRPYIFTKCGLVWGRERKIGNSLTAASVRRECQESLKRLGVDTIDLYQIHWPNPEEEIEEGWSEMARLKEDGLVRHIGVSNFTSAQMKRAAAIAPVETLQPPYSMLRRAIEVELLPWCRDEGIGVIVYSPMLSGMLTGTMTKERAENLPADDWRRNNMEFQEPRLSRNLRLVELLRDIGKRHGRSPGEVAIAWTLRDPVVSGAIVGGRNAAQVEGVVGAADFRLDAVEIGEITAFISGMSS